MGQNNLIPKNNTVDHQSFATHTKFEQTFTGEDKHGIKQSAVFSQGEEANFVDSKNFG